MPIQIQCPKCKARMKAPDGSVGRKARCPRCATLIPILPTDASSDDGEEDVKGGEDAGLFSTTKKPSKPSTPASKSASRKTEKEDFDLGDETAKPIRKGRKIVEEDEDDEEDAKPVRKGRKIVEEADNVVADDDDEEEDTSPMGLQDDPDEEEEEEDRPRKKKKKKKKRRRSYSGGSDVDPELIEKGWNFVKQSFGAGVIGFFCCGPFILVGAVLAIAAIGTGFTLIVKGDSGNGMAQVAMGLLALGFNVGGLILAIIIVANSPEE